MKIDLICVDADDTLWHNEHYYKIAREKLSRALAQYGPANDLLEQIERANFAIYGFGAKGFALSLVEAGARIANARLTADTVLEILQIGKDLLSHPVDILDGVEDALEALADRAPLVLVTKGELAHQESKLTRSGLAGLFSAIEIVSDKTTETFEKIFNRMGVRAQQAVMIGDSLRSDILPALEAGAFAGYIPHPLAWSFECRDEPVHEARYTRLENIGAAVPWIDSLVLPPSATSQGFNQTDDGAIGQRESCPTTPSRNYRYDT